MSNRGVNMSIRERGAEKSLAVALFELARSVPPEGLTLRELVARLGERGLFLFTMVLTIPFLLPVPIPGASTLFGLIIALNGVGLITNTTPWLPDRLMYNLTPSMRAGYLTTKIDPPKTFLLGPRMKGFS